MHQPFSRLERFLLRLLPPGGVGESIIGDLREEFAHDPGVRRAFRALPAVLSILVRYAVPRFVLRKPALPATLVDSGDPPLQRRPLMSVVLDDIRDASRGLRRNLAFTTVSVALVAMGVSASSTVFSFVDAVLLRPIPHLADADRIVRVEERRATPSENGKTLQNVTGADMRRIAAGAPSVEAAGAMLIGGTAQFLSNDGAIRIASTSVSSGFFGVVRTQPLHGRPFSSDDERPGAPKVVIVSHAAWQQYFGGSTSLLGSFITLNEQPTQVVGIMPRDFSYPDAPAIYLPLTQSPFSERFHVTTGIARLRAGVTTDRAALEISKIVAESAQDEPKAGHGVGVRVMQWRDAVTESVRPALGVLSLAAALVLLLTAVNFGGLLITRAARRDQEFAVRQSLGATRGRIIRLLIGEGMLVGFGGALVGAAATAAILRVVVNLSPVDLPFREAIRFEWSVLLFSIAAALIAGLIAGVMPALTSRITSQLRVRAGSTGSATRTGKILVAGQLAIATVLVIASSVLLESFRKALQVDPGVRVDGVLTADINLPRRYDTEERQRQFFNAVLDSLRTSPDVVGAELSLFSPLRGAMPARISLEAGASRSARILPVSAGYTQLLGVQLLGGRELERRDEDAADRVALIDRRGAALLWPDKEAIGATVVTDEGRYRIVGVVDNVKYDNLLADDNDAPLLYVPHSYFPYAAASLIVVSRDQPSALIPVLRSIVARLDPALALGRVETLAASRNQDLAQPRFFSIVVGTFALLGLTLAIAGLYAVTAFAVRARIFEFGIRTALGAQPADNLWLVLREGLVLCAIGVGMGLLLSLQATQLLGAVLFRTEPLDAVAWVLAALVVVAAALAAVMRPALLASRIDPVEAMRRS